MRIATALLLVVVLLALPACRMNERMSGAAFGGIGGAVVGGALGGLVRGRRGRRSRGRRPRLPRG